MFKKFLLCLSVCVVAGIVTTPRTTHGSTQQPPLVRTGAPGETSCASSGCHAGVATQNSPSVTIDLGGGLTSYQAGQTYQMTVATTASGSIFGFEMVALDASNNSVGTFTGNAAQHTNVSTSTNNNRMYVRHFNAHTTPVYTFQWQAPATNVGTITFYTAFNAGNGNGMGSGDNIHLKSMSVDFSTAIGDEPTASVASKGIIAYPNPLLDSDLSLVYRLNEPQDLQLSIFDMSGKLMEQQDLGKVEAGEQQYKHSIDRQRYAVGNYMVHLNGKTYSKTCQITVK